MFETKESKQHMKNLLQIQIQIQHPKSSIQNPAYRYRDRYRYRYRYIYIYICMYVCIYIYMRVCVCCVGIWMRICMCMWICDQSRLSSKLVWTHTCIRQRFVFSSPHACLIFTVFFLCHHFASSSYFALRSITVVHSGATGHRVWWFGFVVACGRHNFRKAGMI